MEKVFMILEIGQKQSFIFESKEVKKNITNSNLIRWVTDVRYFKEAMKYKQKSFDEETNLVYTGGGHTVLEFQSKKEAKEFAEAVTTYTQRNLNGLEMHVKIMECGKDKSWGENLRVLTEKLNDKKQLHASSFHQGSFGIEKIDTNTRKPELACEMGYHDSSKGYQEMERELESMSPSHYNLVSKFDDLGNAKGESSFIAVVHIDGNSMGKRVEEIREALDRECGTWEEYKEKLKRFSDSIDRDFQSAYKEMVSDVEKIMEKNPEIFKALNMESKNFPIRRIITAGDDICYVAEGRIGLESAVIFLNKLREKVNQVDNKPYSACAGVAIVHTKYPFFKAYGLAENLCHNAKNFAASVSRDSISCSAIDWHIEFGEVKDTLESIRQDYIINENTHLEQRPYLVTDEKDALTRNPFQNYHNFRKLIRKFQDKDVDYANGKLKGFREILRRSEAESFNYLKSNLIHDLILEIYQDVYVEMDVKQSFSGHLMEKALFYDVEQGNETVRRCLCFDALELFDSCLLLEVKK